MKLSENAIHIFKTLYSLEGESIEDTFRRVANVFGNNEDEINIAYNLQLENIWRANTPVYFNTGKKPFICSACWVVSITDSMSSIYDIANVARKIFQEGAGIGIPIGNLREKDAPIFEGGDTPTGRSSGAITFMKLFDAVGETTKSGGRVRRAAILCSMYVWHPDIIDFINCKREDEKLASMNLSVAITDNFMDCLKNNIPFSINTPYDGSRKRFENPQLIWDNIIKSAHASAEPGVIFIDRVNKWNPLKKLFLIETTNPCVTGDTFILTNKGHVRIKDVVDKEINIWNGFEFSIVVPKITGYNQKILKIKFSNGMELECTPYHKFILNNNKKIEASQLKIGDKLNKWKLPIIEGDLSLNEKDAYTWGFACGDGSKNKHGEICDIFLYGKKKDLIKFLDHTNIYCFGHRMCIDLPKNKYRNSVPSLPYDIETRLNWLSGIIDSDGSLNSSDGSISITSINYNFLIDISFMLSTLGIFCTIAKTHEEKYKMMPNGKGGLKEYNCQNCYRLLINTTNVSKLINLGFKTNRVKLIANPNRDASRFISVTSIVEKEELETVYCFDEPRNHTGIFNNIYTCQCGEQPLPPFTSCNLSMINIAKFIKWKDEKYKSEVRFDWDELYNVSKNVMLLMDNLIDKMDFPDDRFKTNTLKYRPVGIGIAGLSDALYILNLKYDSKAGRNFAEETYRIITTACVEMSTELAERNGKFSDYDIVKEDIEYIVEQHIMPDDGHDIKTSYVMERIRKFGLRNFQFTTSQPTGTTALSCDASYGIEPCFGLAFQKNLISGEIMNMVNPIFKERFENESWYNDELIEKILANKGSLKGLRGIPKDVKDIFVTAYDIKSVDRVEMQSVIQKRVSTAVSSTVNLQKETTIEEVSELFKLAYERGLKGITIYRDGSRKGQPITFKETKDGDIVVQSNIELPTKLQSERYSINFGEKKLYVHVSTFEGMPVEVFLTSGSQDPELNGFLECIGKILSVSLQHRVPREKLTKQMRGIISRYPVWCKLEDTDKKPLQIQSMPDGVAAILDKFYSDNNEDNDSISGAEYCPKCNAKSYVMVQGCPVCQSCGYSKCS